MRVCIASECESYFVACLTGELIESPKGDFDNTKRVDFIYFKKKLFTCSANLSKVAECARFSVNEDKPDIWPVENALDYIPFQTPSPTLNKVIFRHPHILLS